MGRKDNREESIIPEWDREEFQRSSRTVDEATYEKFSELHRSGKGFSSQTMFRDIMEQARLTGSKITAEQVLACLAEMDLE